MRENELSAMTEEQLLAARKKSRSWLFALGPLMVLISIFLVHTAIRKGDTALLVIPICMFITLLPIGARLTRIKAEIDTRSGHKRT